MTDAAEPRATFVSTHEDALFFTDPPLAPGGSWFLYAADLGLGLTIFRTRGYR